MAKILIADDEPNILLLLDYLIKKEGHDVALAHDGVETLSTVAHFSPDLLLLDVMMPNKSGYEVCQALRADPRYAQLKIIMLSAKGKPSEISKGLGLGADAYVTKPFANRDLLDHIARQLVAA